MPKLRDLYDLLQEHLRVDDEDPSVLFHLVWAEDVLLDEFARKLGAEADSAFQTRYSQLVDTAPGRCLWGDRIGSWVQAFLEWDVPDDSHVRALSQGGRRAFSIKSGYNNYSLLEWAVDGEIVTSFTVDWPDPKGGSDPHALDHLMEGLHFQLEEPGPTPDPVTVEVSLTSALRLAGRITGHELTEAWLADVHTCYPLRSG
ncbi:DUF6461 domain-containing protein [Nonomuraea sp. NPDC055795]